MPSRKGSAKTECKPRRAPNRPKTSALERFAYRHNLNPDEIARRLKISSTVVRRLMDDGSPPNLRTATKLVYGSNFEIDWEDLMPIDEKLACSSFRGALIPSGRRS